MVASMHITKSVIKKCSLVLRQTDHNGDGGAQNLITDDEISQRSEEHVADKGEQSQHEWVGSNLLQPLLEGEELVQFSENIINENRERTTVVLPEISGESTPRQIVDKETDGALNISTENIEEISVETTPKQTVDLSDDGAQNVMADADVSQRSEEHVADKGQLSQHEAAGSNLMPLRESDLVVFSDYITYDIQERISLMLGFDLNKVEILRCKHRENVTAVGLDLLIDWMRCNPQPTNRLVSHNR